jgi:hypothetical protein
LRRFRQQKAASATSSVEVSRPVEASGTRE